MSIASDILIVRSIIQDKPVYASDIVNFDGAVQQTFRLTYSPIDPLSVVTTPATPPTTVNAETGFLTWAAPPANVPVLFEYNKYILSDQTITDLITVNTFPDGTYELQLVAADCLDAIASNQAIIQKVIQSLDLKTDGASLAEALRAHAEVLRKLVFDPKYQVPSFDFAEQINTLSGYKEKILKDLLRIQP